MLIGHSSSSISEVKEIARSNHHNQNDGDSNCSRIDVRSTLLVSRLLISRCFTANLFFLQIRLSSPLLWIRHVFFPQIRSLCSLRRTEECLGLTEDEGCQGKDSLDWRILSLGERKRRGSSYRC